MQTYALNLTNDSRSYSSAGDLFVYESGQVAGNEGADLRIIVKPDSGGEITLKPGQQFRLPKGESAMQWYVRAATPGNNITGYIIIGAGEFDDANTLNTFKLDGTFTNAVKVTNTEAERVPVSLDPKQLLQQTAPLMAYNASREVNISSATGPTTLFTAAENVNGLIIEQVQTYTQYAIELRAGGVFLMRIMGLDRTRIKIPAGVALTAGMTTTATGELKALFTVL